MEALFDPRELSRNELAAEALRSFGELRLCVTGSSMLPGVRPDDRLLVRCCGIEEIGQGDIVLFIRHRRLFAHRVVSLFATHLITQGDTLAEPDFPVTANELLGKVIQVIRRGRTIRHQPNPGWPARIAAALFRRSTLAGRLFIRMQDLQRRVGL
jgi:hypothetical protein